MNKNNLTKQNNRHYSPVDLQKNQLHHKFNNKMTSYLTSRCSVKPHSHYIQYLGGRTKI